MEQNGYTEESYEEPRRQADADREGSGSLRSRESGARQENEERMEALMRKKVFICSPFRGDMEGNARKAAAYSRMACEEGHLPIAPHLLSAEGMRSMPGL